LIDSPQPQAFDHIGVREVEARFQQRGAIVDLRPDQEHLRHRRDHDARAVLFHDLVQRVDRRGVVHRVFHARAAALLDPDAQALMAVARHQPRDLRGGGGGERDGLLAGNAEHRGVS
jgi:hypothetical protein